MFCSKCGTDVGDAAAFCAKCGTAVGEAGAPPRMGQGAIAEAKAVSREAWTAFRAFAGNPVGGLGGAYAQLAEPRALRVGVAFAAIYVLCALLGGYFVLPQFMRQSVLDSLGFGGFVKCVLVVVVPFLSIAAIGAAIRTGFRGTGRYGADVFVAGACVLPMGLLLLAGGLLGLGNVEVTVVLSIFAFCLSVFIAFAGYTRVYGVTERAATFAVPGMLVVGAWLAKVMYAALLQQAF